jgi:hypothetical protein
MQYVFLAICVLALVIIWRWPARKPWKTTLMNDADRLHLPVDHYQKAQRELSDRPLKKGK